MGAEAQERRTFAVILIKSKSIQQEQPTLRLLESFSLQYLYIYVCVCVCVCGIKCHMDCSITNRHGYERRVRWRG
jgi:hypothetical protein